MNRNRHTVIPTAGGGIYLNSRPQGFRILKFLCSGVHEFLKHAFLQNEPNFQTCPVSPNLHQRSAYGDFIVVPLRHRSQKQTQSNPIRTQFCPKYPLLAHAVSSPKSHVSLWKNQKSPFLTPPTPKKTNPI